MSDSPPSPEPGLADLIRSDLDRFAQTYRLRGDAFPATRVFWESIFFKAGFQSVVLYRLAHWLYRRGWVYPAWFVTRFSVWATGAEIEFNARIGPGLFIPHPVGIVIGRGSTIGRQATIFQGVTFGVKDWRPDNIHRYPTTGDRCCFFSHAVIVGDINIGDECVVAAQTLLAQDLPSGSLGVGIPARVIPEKGRELIAQCFQASEPTCSEEDPL